MNIGRKRTNRPLIVGVLLVLALSAFYLMASSNGKLNGKSKKATEKKDLNIPTTVYRGYNYGDVIRNGLNKVYSDSTVSLYFHKELGVPFLMYVYRDSLTERQLNDKFYLHVYLKDSLTLKDEANKKFINLDFRGQAIELGIADRKHYIFKKFLAHNLLDLGNVSQINTGRFARGSGKSLSIEGIKLDTIKGVEVSNNLSNLTISVKEKDFEKIVSKRNNALQNGILVTEEEDLVKSKISYDNVLDIDAEVRLKGDWTDHLDHENKWSFRAITEGLKTVNGTRKFSIQHPKVRNYLWEWLFNKAMKESDLIGLRYDFVNVYINITKKKEVIKNIPIGIMAFEEAFDKILIENNRRREGLILGFDESLLWQDRARQNQLNLTEEARSRQLQTINNAPIKVYNENKVLADPKLNKQFQIAKDLLEGVRKGELKVSQAFDVDKLASFVALTNVFGGKHGLVVHNLRIYYNPITNKLEPISFDSNSGLRLSEIVNYPFSKGDELYEQKLVEKLEYYSSSEFINSFIKGSFDELSELTLNMSREFGSYLDLSVLEYNSNFIKKRISPAKAIVSGFINLNETDMSLEITNLADFPVVIEQLEHENGRNLSKGSLDKIIYPSESGVIKFNLKRSFENAFVSKKNKKGGFRYPKDVAKLKVQYRILGLSDSRRDNIIPFAKNQDISGRIKAYQRTFEPNLGEFSFIEVNEEAKQVVFKKGEHKLTQNLVIGKGYEVIIDPGFSLDFINNASIISYASFRCNGTRENPIKFYSSDSTGGGIFVSNTSIKSVLNYTFFDNLSNPNSDIWEVSGAVNFHEAEVAIDNSVFENNRCEDGLNIIRSEFSIANTTFRNTYSDAFDGDFVEGTIRDSHFLNSGNDGIDISGSHIQIEGIQIQNPSDKGISAGEASQIEGKNIVLTGGEIGIVSKDLSKVTLVGVTISDTKLGFSAFQKKSEFGNGIIEISGLKLSNTVLDHLIEEGSRLTIDQVAVETVSNRVIDQMYGNEYGKSSR